MKSKGCGPKYPPNAGPFQLMTGEGTNNSLLQDYVTEAVGGGVNDILFCKWETICECLGEPLGAQGGDALVFGVTTKQHEGHIPGVR